MKIEITSDGIRIDSAPEKWIKEDRGGVEYTAICPKCGYATFWSDIKHFNYCPACGVKLEHGE